MPVKSQASFTGGEITPGLHERVTLEKYLVATKTMKNMFCHSFGGASNRAGYEFIFKVLDDTKQTRLIPFSFNTTQTYMLAFSHQVMIVIKDKGIVLEPSKNITSITQANPGVVTIPSHGFNNGDTIFLASIGGMTELNVKYVKVANATTNTFSLQDRDGNNIDTTSYSSYTSGGTASRVFTLTTPYSHTDLRKLKFTQSADVMTIVSKLYQERELSRTNHHIWNLNTISFQPEIAAPSGSSGTPASSGSETYYYEITAVATESLEESLPESITVSNSADISGSDISINIAAVLGATKYNIYRKENGISGYIGSTEDTGSGAFVDDNILPDLSDTPPGSRNPFSSGNYPDAVIYHDQRRIFGGLLLKPQSFEGTQIGNFYNMNVSSPAKATDAISFTLGSNQVNEIRHFISLNDLLIFTNDSEWRARAGSNSDTLSAANPPDVKAQSYVGSSNVPPLIIKNTALFVEDGGQRIYDLGYQLEVDGYDGNELSILASHLFEGQEIVEWAYAKRPHSIIWAVRDDGVLLGMTYLREHQVFGWHRHITDGVIESVATIKEGSEDAVYIVVKRTINGVERRYIERLHTRQFLPLVEDAFFVDSGLTLDSWNKNTSSTVTLSGGTNWTTDETLTLTENGVLSPFSASNVGNTIAIRIKNEDGTIKETARLEITGYTSTTQISVKAITKIPELLRNIATTHYATLVSNISGLDHLEGKTVSIFADGNVKPQMVVTNGTITLSKPVAKAHIGLAYSSILETLDIDLNTAEGGTQTRKKVVSKVDVSFLNSRGGYLGPDENNLTEIKPPAPSNYGKARDLITDRIEHHITPDWNETGHIYFKQTDPLPVTILAIMPTISFGDE